MTGLVIATLLALLMVVIGDLVSEEVRTRLERAPFGLLRVAALMLPRDQREARLIEWVGETEETMERASGMPITRLIEGLNCACGLIWAAPQVRSILALRRPVWSIFLRAAGTSTLAIVTLSCLITLFVPVRTAPLESVMVLGIAAVAAGRALRSLGLPGGRIVIWAGLTATFVPYAIFVGEPWAVWLPATAAVGLIGVVSGALSSRLRPVAAALSGLLPATYLAVLFGLNSPQSLLALIEALPSGMALTHVALTVLSCVSVCHAFREARGVRAWPQATTTWSAWIPQQLVVCLINR